MTDRLPLSAADLFALAKDALAKGGRFTFAARGYSMFPFIADGERVTLEGMLLSSLREGDIILCRTADGPVLHGIVDRGVDGNGAFVVVRAVSPAAQTHRVREADGAGRVVHIRKRPMARLLFRLKRHLQPGA